MKKIIHYISHFFYLTFHWNIFLACFVTWHEIKRGTRYGINTIKREKLEKLTIPSGDISKSSPYEAVTYYMLEKLLTAFRQMSDATSLTDLGCGKGRVLVAAAHFGFTSVTGVEFARELCREAETNLMYVQKKFPALKWKVVCSDVLHYRPGPEENVFFMFNPFNKEILEQFILNNKHKFLQDSEPVYFLYASPVHLDVLKKYGFAVQYYLRNLNLEGAILKKECKSA